MKHSLIYIILMLANFCGFSQTAIFSWDECSEATYDSTQVTAAQLEDTYALCFGNIAMIEDNIFWVKPEDANKLNVGDLVNQYYTRLSKIRNLKIVNLPFFEEVRQDQLNYLNHCFLAKRVAMLSYKNPGILGEYTGFDNCEYTNIIIEGGQQMLEHWKILWRKHCDETNGNPEKCFENNYTNLKDSPHKFFYAHRALLTFGWWNTCANKNLYVNAIKDERKWEEFKKLFVKIKSIENCD